MQKSIFDFNDYKDFLREWLKSLPGRGRGKRTELASAMNCKLAYVSQILNGDAQLSLEQAEILARYWGFSKDETEFLFLLVQLGRAGTENLRRFFLTHVEQTRAKRAVLKERFGVAEGMSELDRARYYSAWYFTAAHFLLTIPHFRSRAEISRRLDLEPQKVAEILDFLVKAGLAIQEGDRFLPTKMTIHLGNDSPEIIKHHANWRTRAIIASESETAADLHYSSVMSLSKSDAKKIRELIVQQIEQVREKVLPSPEEELYSFCLDWFTV
jgi:uncharacterized protein (TIGR02147 family)